ncbi:hypothetical protein PoB_003696400, partial [Plakobranchus ocellatus]
MASPQLNGLRFSGHLFDQGTCDGIQSRDIRVSADLTADSLSIVPFKTPQEGVKT